MGSYWSSFYSTEKGATTPTDTETNRRGKRANDTDLDTDNLEDPLLYTPQKCVLPGFLFVVNLNDLL